MTLDLQNGVSQEVPESNPATSSNTGADQPKTEVHYVPTFYDLMLAKCYRDAMGNPYFWESDENGNKPVYLDSKEAVDTYCYGAGWPKKKDAKEMVDKLRIVTAKTKPIKPLYRRVQKYGQDGVELKLNNSQSVKVTADEVVIGDHEGNFLSPSDELPLAMPDIENGSIEPFLDALGLTDAEERILITGLLMVYLYPDIPFPVLVVVGPEGSGKTAFCGSLVSLIDNNFGLQNTAVKSKRDLFVNAASRRVLCFENVSEIDDELSDAYCVVATGGYSRERKLYTNTGVSGIKLGNPQIISGISNPLKRDDLRDRAILIELPVLTNGMPMDVYQRAIQETLPGALGHLIRGMQTALQNLGTTTTQTRLRMADAVRLVTAAASEFGWGAGAFEAAYWRNHLKVTRQCLYENPVYEVLDRLLQRNGGRIEKTATDLLNSLGEEAARHTPRLDADKDWPKTANKLSEALHRLEGSLAEVGVRIAWERTATSRTVRITSNTRTENG